MKTMGVKITLLNGVSISPTRAFTRFLYATALHVLPMALGYAVHPTLYLLILAPTIWTLANKERRALYDVLVSTRLVVHQVAPTR